MTEFFFFFFLLVLSTLNISSHCLLVFRFYDEKLTEKIIDNPLYVNHFSPATFKILFVFAWSLCLYYLKFVELLKYVNYCFFYQIWEASGHEFLQILFLPLPFFLLSFWDSHYAMLIQSQNSLPCSFV